MTRHVTVELFCAPLEIEAALQREFAETLSAAERDRAAALAAPRDRARFIADHGWRRRLLGERVGVAPAELGFGLGEHGKPHLAGPGPHFSASRSGAVAWYALCDARPVGVDIEAVDRDRPLEPLARRLLSDRERGLLAAIPSEARAQALYDCWTCKEAAVKALGTGLVFPLTALEAWGAGEAVVRTRDLEIHGLPAGRGRAGAVAVAVGSEETAAILPLVALGGP